MFLQDFGGKKCFKLNNSFQKNKELQEHFLRVRCKTNILKSYLPTWVMVLCAVVLTGKINQGRF